MTIDDIKKLEMNENRLKEINDIYPQVTPFVGAGVSKGCGLFTWDELLKKLTGEYMDDSYETLVKKYGKMQVVDRMISAVDENETAVMNQIRDFIIMAQNQKIRSEIPKILTSNFCGTIITTNYDTILEEAISDGCKLSTILPFMREQTTKAVLDSSRCLLKIHGSIEELSSMVISSAQYDRAYGKIGSVDFEKSVPLALSQIFMGHRVLFVGCSLEEDRTMEILKAVIRRNNSISHYAIVELPENLDNRKKLKIRLDSLGILPVYYPEGKHESLEMILKYIVRDKKKHI